MAIPNVIFTDTLDSFELDEMLAGYDPGTNLLFQGPKEKAKEEAYLMGSNDEAELVTICRETKDSETGEPLKKRFYRIRSYINPKD